MAVAPLSITSIREQVVDFTKPFMNTGISIMIQKPERAGNKVFAFLTPLAVEIWICIFFAYVAVSIVLFLISRLNPYQLQIMKELETDYGGDNFAENKEDRGLEVRRESIVSRVSLLEAEERHEFSKSIINSFWFSLGALMQQGSELQPKTLSGKIQNGFELKREIFFSECHLQIFVHINFRYILSYSVEFGGFSV